MPCKKGQNLHIKPLRGSDLVWESFDEKGELWFEAQISLYDFSSIRTSDDEISRFIQKLLKGAVRQNSEFLNNWNGYRVNTFLEFSKEWGLGSSSSLIYTVSEWAEVNPFLLYYEISEGSAYDIACAFADGPVLYQKTEDSIHYEEIDLKFPFEECLYLVYLGKKQNSEAAVNYYRSTVHDSSALVDRITELSAAIIECKEMTEFQKLLVEHENLIADSIKLPRVQKERFSDFCGTVKSLGAWGGDFALAVVDQPLAKVSEFFKNKGLNTVIPYKDLVL